MRKLFKYISLENALKSIKNQGIYACPIVRLNDPYEYRGIEYPEDYRVCSLTSSNLQMLMWAYYGYHQGCCIQYEIDECDIVRQVDYVDTYYSRDLMDQGEVFNSLYTKSKEWEKENEYRIVYYRLHEDKDLWRHVNEDIYFKARITGLIFGYVVDYQKDVTQNLLREIRDYNDQHSTGKINVSKCLLNTGEKFGLRFDKQFDYTREIIKVL